MRLVKLTRWDGVPIHVNPARILYVEPRERDGTGECLGSVVVFDQVWHPEYTNGRATESVKERPSAVATLCLSPLGRDAA